MRSLKGVVKRVFVYFSGVCMDADKWCAGFCMVFLLLFLLLTWVEEDVWCVAEIIIISMVCW